MYCNKCNQEGHGAGRCPNVGSVSKKEEGPKTKRAEEATVIEPGVGGPGISGGSEKVGRKSQVQMNREWREKHPDRYREYMRNYMREYRQRVK